MNTCFDGNNRAENKHQTHIRIENVSFVFIARNEAYAVDKCLRAILSMPLENCEVIAVDSDSTDGTLDIMKRYAAASNAMSVFSFNGHLNSAIARNIGLKRARKKYICFCDGDTEWESNFVRQSLKLLEAGEADAVTGSLKEIVYSHSYKKILETSDRISYPTRMAIHGCGGNFMVRKEIADKTGLWDERMVRNQDIDYTLRVSRYGRFIGIPVLMGTHHTQTYDERLWDFLKNDRLRAHGALIRKNLDRPKVIVELLKKNKGFLAGYIFFTLCIVVLSVRLITSSIPTYILLAPLYFLLADLLWCFARGKGALKKFATHYCYIPSIIRGLLFGAGPYPSGISVKQIV